MIKKIFSGADQVSNPYYLGYGQPMAISISGTFVATIAIQRLLLQEGPYGHPEDNDDDWNTVVSYTVPVEQKVDSGEGVWYRGKCLAYTSGNPKIILK